MQRADLFQRGKKTLWDELSPAHHQNWHTSTGPIPQPFLNQRNEQLPWKHVGKPSEWPFVQTRGAGRMTHCCPEPGGFPTCWDHSVGLIKVYENMRCKGPQECLHKSTNTNTGILSIGTGRLVVFPYAWCPALATPLIRAITAKLHANHWDQERA